MHYLPSFEEVQKAIMQMSFGKAPGPDAIFAEVYKCGGPRLTQQLLVLFETIWDSENVLQDFKDASVVHFFKRKGDWYCCENHRGIPLSSIAGKVLTRILLKRLVTRKPHYLRVSVDFDLAEVHLT